MSPPEADPEPSMSPARAPDFDPDEIHRIISRFFRVYEVEKDIKGLPSGQIAAYYVQTSPDTFTENFEALREAVRGIDPNLFVILQHRLGEDVLLVAKKPPVVHKGPAVNIILLVLTVITTTMSGAIFWQPMSGAENLIEWNGIDFSWLHPRMLAMGFLTFSVPLIAILGVHELGHYYWARRHRVHTSLPYFIPVPPVVPIGTFGAFISMREPIPDRKALFDIGASGPLAGFLVAIPVVVLGLVLTAVYAVPLPPQPAIHADVYSPLDGVAFAYNETLLDVPDAANKSFSFGTATFLSEVGDEDRYVERITFNATNGTLPAGTWRLELAGYWLEAEQSIDATLRVEGDLGTEATGDFRTQDDGSHEASVQRALEEANYTRSAYAFEVPPNATRLGVEMAWDKPASPFIRLGDSLLFFGISWVVDRFEPSDDDIFTHPTGIAGWVGLLVTGFNLLPVGQLDGGHVARAVLGERMRWAGYLSIGLMFALSFRFPGWMIMAILIVFLGLHHPPPLNDKSPLDARRRFWAFVVWGILLATFVPFPFIPA